MTDGLTIREIFLRHNNEKQELYNFLASFNLKYEQDIEVAFGVFDYNERLLGCGCACGSLLKCFAITEELRGQNAMGLLISSLMNNRFARGFYELFVITREHNEALFTGCGFTTVVKCSGLVMLENRKNGPESFCKRFYQAEDDGKTIGAIVMNCNPFTCGHLALIEYASQNCDVLHIFVVEENKSMFDTQTRFQLVQQGTSHLSNVRVHLSGHYMISSATFPTYFLKEGEDASQLYIYLDVMLFAQRIAPVLHITKRFAGQEPLDPTTACYNNAMREILPQHGIEFCEIPRAEAQGQVISASWVRSLLGTPDGIQEAVTLVPPCTAAYLQEHYGK